MKQTVKKNIRILLVDDDDLDYTLFKENLSLVKNNHYTLTWANSYEKALELIKLKEHDVYFFDYRLGLKTGLDLIKDVVALDIDAPIIILTGLKNQETDMKAMELGASDYLVKDEINPEQLERSIRYCIEHNRMVKELKASEIKFRNIFENSHDVIFISKEDGKIIDINKSAERVLGYSKEEMVNLNASVLCADKGDGERFLKEMQEKESCENFELVLLDKFGKKKYCTLTANIQREGSIYGGYFQGIIRDMTLFKKAEYDRIIAEKLTIAGKVAQTLAHEVRNPLMNINLSTEQLEESIQDKSINHLLEIINRNSKRINDLITKLLENSKPLELKESLTLVQNVFLNTLEDCKDRAKLKNIQIETDFDFNDESMIADESKLTIAFLNIMINAIEAVQKNTGVIKIRVNCKDKKCFVCIEDNGPGIPAKHLEKIFEPYYTSKITGVGLGLTTTKRIIHTHNGTIDVETKINVGTKFKIELDLF